MINERYYSVAQIARMIEMHPKTIQRYIREGKLRAAKIGKSWRVTGHDLSIFMEEHGPETAQPQAAVPARDRTKTSAVIDIAVIGKDDADRIIRSLQAAMNGKPTEYGQASMTTQFLEGESTLRIALWGNLPFTAAVMNTIEMFMEQLGEDKQ